MTEKCIICDAELIDDSIFLCEGHARQINDLLQNKKDIIHLPDFREHCMICGEWEGRTIINYPEWNYVCDVCLHNALEKYRRD